MTLSQWDCLLLNLGAWEGSFSRLSAQGELLEDIPTCVTFEGLNHNQTMRQTVQYFSAATQALTQEKVLEYSSLNQSTRFFETGAFSQGSLQWGPFSEFGAELGFMAGDRRLRLVELFNPAQQLDKLTLIREKRRGTQAPEQPHLTVAALLGTWQGNATTLYADWRSPDTYATSLTLTQTDNQLHQSLTAPNFQYRSKAQIAGNRLEFTQGSQPIQVLLLPDGASATTPLTIPKGKPFFLEAGWLLSPSQRQRMIRTYDDKGGWVSLTLVLETKQVD